MRGPAKVRSLTRLAALGDGKARATAKAMARAMVAMASARATASVLGKSRDQVLIPAVTREAWSKQLAALSNLHSLLDWNVPFQRASPWL